MTDAEFRQLERELESLAQDFRALRQKVQDMDVKGTAVTQVQLSDIKDDVRDLKAAFLRMEDSKAGDRRVVLGALLAGGTALIMTIIGVLIQILTRGNS